MYSVTLRKEVIAYHHLPLAGKEANNHPHDYLVEVAVYGPRLDENGFLINLDSLETNLDRALAYFEGKTLNDLDVLEGKAPTLENFCWAVWTILRTRLQQNRLTELKVTIWESEKANATYNSRLAH